MIDVKDRVLSFAEKTSEQLPPVLERLFSAAQPDAVYSKPVVSGNYTVITAREVVSGGGFGSGVGFGPENPSSTKKQTQEEATSKQINSGGGGMGGGGGSSGRPIAVIVIGPDGVSVQPVMDVTKVALAGLTTGVFMLTMFRRMLRARRP